MKNRFSTGWVFVAMCAGMTVLAGMLAERGQVCVPVTLIFVVLVLAALAAIIFEDSR